MAGMVTAKEMVCFSEGILFLFFGFSALCGENGDCHAHHRDLLSYYLMN